MEKIQGKTFLLVMGILMIISGAFAIIASGIVVCGGALISSASGLVGGVLVIYGLAAFLGGALTLVAGIMGCVKSGKPGKATGCVVIGIIAVLLSLVSLIVSASMGYDVTAFSVISTIALPVVYVIAAILKK